MSTDDVQLAADVRGLTAALETVSRDMVDVRASLAEESETRRLENAELRAQNALLLRQNQRLERGRKLNRKLASLALVLGLVLLVGGFFLVRTVQRVSCLNDALATRQAVGTPSALLNQVLGQPADAKVTDSDASSAAFRALNAARIPGQTPDEQKTAGIHFFDVTAEVERVQKANKAYRLENRLGEC